LAACSSDSDVLGGEVGMFGEDLFGSHAVREVCDDALVGHEFTLAAALSQSKHAPFC
jgi:hypothetical protein